MVLVRKEKLINMVLVELLLKGQIKQAEEEKGKENLLRKENQIEENQIAENQNVVVNSFPEFLKNSFGI